jgi:hypothetical protein
MEAAGMTRVNSQMGPQSPLPRSNTGGTGDYGAPMVPPNRMQAANGNQTQTSGARTMTNGGIATQASNRSDQATLVGGVEDGNSTLVNMQNGARKEASGGIVPYLTLVPDNKRFPTMEYPIVGIVKVGRYLGNSAHKDEAMFTFKSKVISRYHAEVWSVGNDVYLRDTRSQSGTFLNAMRLSEPGKESKPYKLKTGDIIQFGVDYKGATDGKFVTSIILKLTLFCLDNSRCITVRVDIRLQAEGGGGGGGIREEGAGGETLVNGNNENMTLVGQATVAAEQTLFGAGSGNGTAVSNNSASGTFAPVVGPVPPKRGLPSPGGGFNTQPRMSPGPGGPGYDNNGMMDNGGYASPTAAFRPPPNRAMMRPPMAGM